MRGAQNPLKGILSKGGHPTICLCVCKTSNLAITLRHLGVFQIFVDHRKGKIEANPNLRPECHNSQNRPPKNTFYWRTTFLADRSRTDKVHLFFKKNTPSTPDSGPSPGRSPAIPTPNGAYIGHPTPILADFTRKTKLKNWGQFLINYTVGSR